MKSAKLTNSNIEINNVSEIRQAKQVIHNPWQFLADEADYKIWQITKVGNYPSLIFLRVP